MRFLKSIGVSSQFIFLNYASLIIAILNTYLRPQLFSVYFEESNFAILMLFYGLSVYLAFLDGGVSKPLYALIRELFINNDDKYIQYVSQAFTFFIGVFAVSLLLFCSAMLLLRHLIEQNISILLVCLISLNLVLNFTLINFKNILIAIDKYEFFQRIELLRRGTVLLTILSLFIDSSFVLGNAVVNGFLIILIFYVKANTAPSYPWFRLSDAKRFYLSLFSKAKHYFVFTINETLIYNSGFIIIPLFYNDFSVIQFSLSIALYNGIAMLSRSVLDISLHDMTKRFIKGNIKRSFKNFKYSILISSSLSVLFFLILYLMSDFIFNLWVGVKYNLSNIMYLGLFIFLVGNVIQHISGTLLVSVHNNYRSVKKLSFNLMVSVVFVQLIVSLFSFGVDIFFFSTSIVYLVGSIIYFNRGLRLFRS